MNQVSATDPCPCGQSLDFGSCCEPIHRSGAGLGITAEQLMRARYCAYFTNNEKFLLDSWDPDTRPKAVTFTSGIRWTGLTINETTDGGGLDAVGTVEFTASFETDEGPKQLHEVSSFVRHGANWFYVDGIIGT